jgi:hypothetical protein
VAFRTAIEVHRPHGFSVELPAESDPYQLPSVSWNSSNALMGARSAYAGRPTVSVQATQGDPVVGAEGEGTPGNTSVVGEPCAGM